MFWSMLISIFAICLGLVFADFAQCEPETIDSEAGMLFFATYRYRANNEAVNSPYLIGALLTFYWSEIEKEESVYDWSDLDLGMRPWIEAGKKIALRIMWSSSGRWADPGAKHPTPQWVIDRGAAIATAKRSQTQVPLPWDPIYQQSARKFLREVARKFDGDSNILFIDVTPGAETNPYRFGMNRSEPEFRDEFRKMPDSTGRTYSDGLWLDTVKEYIDDASSIFTKTRLLVTLNVGSMDGPSPFHEIGSYCVERGLYVGQNGLNRNSYLKDSPRRQAFLDWGNRTRLYFEMVAATGRRAGTLMEVMKAAERIGCSYLGVYPQDILRSIPNRADYDVEYENALVYGAKAIVGHQSQESSREQPRTNPASRRRIPTAKEFQEQVPPGVRWIPDIAYREGNEAWRLDLAMPREQDEAQRPGLVIVHGGGWAGNDKRMGQWGKLPLEYAQKGYVAISVNYRLSGEAPFPACVEDVMCAVRWFRAHAEELSIDPKRIGGYGNSAGAHLVAMLGLAGPKAELAGDGPYQEQSSLLNAVCASAVPTDFLNWHVPIEDHRVLAPLLAGPEGTLMERARKASPITYVHADAPPFLIIHGTADRTVDVSQADRFVDALREAGAKDVTYMRFDNAGHGVFGQHRDETYPAMEQFFARTLCIGEEEADQ